MKRGHGGERTVEYRFCRDIIENSECGVHEGCVFRDGGDGDDGGARRGREGGMMGGALSYQLRTVLTMNQWRSFK